MRSDRRIPYFAQALFPLALLSASAAGCADEPTTSSDAVAEADLFGIGVTHFSLTVVSGPAGSPICFQLNAWKPNQLIDFVGANIDRDNTTSPFLHLPASDSSGAKDYTGTGKLCAGADSGLYITVQEYVPSTTTDGAGTPGPERHFRVGELRDVAPSSLVSGKRLDEEQSRITGDFKAEFREVEGYSYVRFSITSTRRPTELSSAPNLAKLP